MKCLRIISSLNCIVQLYSLSVLHLNCACISKQLINCRESFCWYAPISQTRSRDWITFFFNNAFTYTIKNRLSWSDHNVRWSNKYPPKIISICSKWKWASGDVIYITLVCSHGNFFRYTLLVYRQYRTVLRCNH